MNASITHQLAARLGSAWLIDPETPGLDELVLPRPHLLMRAASRALDAIEHAHGTVAGLWPTLPPGFAERHRLPREADNFADGYDMLDRPDCSTAPTDRDPLLAWAEPPARTWLREHAIDNAEVDHQDLFVDASLGAAPVAGLIPRAWYRRTDRRRLTLAEQVPALAAAIDHLGWFMLYLDSNGESPRLLIYVASERCADLHAWLRRSILEIGIAHTHAEHVGGDWRVRRASG